MSNEQKPPHPSFQISGRQKTIRMHWLLADRRHLRLRLCWKIKLNLYVVHDSIWKWTSWYRFLLTEQANCLLLVTSSASQWACEGLVHGVLNRVHLIHGTTSTNSKIHNALMQLWFKICCYYQWITVISLSYISRDNGAPAWHDYRPALRLDTDLQTDFRLSKADY